MNKEKPQENVSTSSPETTEMESPEIEIQEQQSSETSTTIDELKDLKDRLLRQMAETENIRKRSTKATNEAREYAIFEFSKDLISVMDNFDRTLEHSPNNMGKESQAIIEGIKMTKNELESVFKKHKLENIQTKIGDKFDYNIHNAISQIESKEVKNDCIVQIMQPGYKIRERLIRPATVIVAKSDNS